MPSNSLLFFVTKLIKFEVPINSQINPEPNQLTITGGTPIGTNLFHSFTDFNINPANAAYFTPATGIETIISRYLMPFRT
jgi:large exoprotein involved in heme utilization and adhesion